MKLLICDGAIQLGQALQQELQYRELAHEFLEGTALDPDEPAAFVERLRDLRPSQLINIVFEPALQAPEAGAYFDSKQALAASVACAKAAQELGIPLIHLSSPAVFDGRKLRPYIEEDEIRPRPGPGEDMAEAEALIARYCPEHIIVRSDSVFSPAELSWFEHYLGLFRKQGGRVSVPERRFSPTPASDLARVLVAIALQLDCDARPWGLFHYCALQGTSQGSFLREFLQDLVKQEKLSAAELEQLTIETIEPGEDEVRNTVLDCHKIMGTFGIKQRSRAACLEDVANAIVLA